MLSKVQNMKYQPYDKRKTNEVLMNTRRKTNWWIDLTVFAGFIAAFFLDQTGVIAHQWIGILSGLLAAYHLFLHLDWVKALSKRFYGKTSAQTQFYYALDALLLIGFTLIAATGLMISTWLNLSLSNYVGWLNLHITISIATLGALVLKLTFHWRWIVSTTRKIWSRPVKVPAPSAGLQPVKAGASSMGRREFLQVMGIAGTASFLALANASKSLADTLAASEDTATTAEVTAQTDPTSTASTVDLSSSESVNTTSTTDTSPSVSSSTESTADTSSSASSSSSCTVQCHKNCAYPGHCKRYVDTNNSDRCDLSECL